MASRNIQFHDSVQNMDEWKTVRDKKERIKIKTQKKVNSDLYLTFTDNQSIYIFLFFLLAPEQAFNFQKVQAIINKMKGDTQPQKKNFQQLKRMLHLNWDGVAPLTHLIKQKRKDIIRQQKLIYDVSQKITDQEAKQLIRSGLSQRKIHLDVQNSDGSNQEALIPTVENIDDCITIIHDEKNNQYLLAFFSHIDQQEKKQAQAQSNANTFVGRPINYNAENPDDRPLPIPQKNFVQANSGNQPRRFQQNYDKPQPTVARQILNPDQKLLSPPQVFQNQNVNRSAPKNVVNPDDRLLVPPPKQEKKTTSSNYRPSSGRKSNQNQQSNSRVAGFVNVDARDTRDARDYRDNKDVREASRNYNQPSRYTPEQTKNHHRYHWVEIGVAAIIILGGIKILKG